MEKVVNLLPWREEIAAKKQRFQRLLFPSIFTFLFILVVVIIIILGFKIKTQAILYSKLKSQQSIMRPQYNEFIAVNRSRTKLIRLNNKITTLLNQQNLGLYLLHTIPQHLSAAIILHSLKFFSNKVVLTGFAKSHRSISNFLANFPDLKLKSYKDRFFIITGKINEI